MQSTDSETRSIIDSGNDKLILNSNRNNFINNAKNDNERIYQELYQIKKQQTYNSVQNIIQESNHIKIRNRITKAKSEKYYNYKLDKDFQTSLNGDDNKQINDPTEGFNQNKINRLKENYSKSSNKLNFSESKESDSTRINKNESLSKDMTYRRDIYGNSIIKGSKTHKLAFIDMHFNKNIRKKLVKNISVESYKKYNEDVSKRKHDDSFSSRCNCIIF